MRYRYRIGTTRDNLTFLSDLSLEPPHQNFVPYSQIIRTGSGLVKGQGWAEDEWFWGFLTSDQRATLRTYVPSAGAHIFVTDLKDDGVTYADFECDAEWQKQEDRQSGIRIGFPLKLTGMIELP